MRHAPIAWLASITAAAVVCAAAPAAAQEAIPTAQGAADGGAPGPAGPPDQTLRLSDHIDGGPGFLRPVGPCGGPLRDEDGKLDKTPHGAVWAGVGTHGYRDIGGAVCVPVGESGSVNIAIDAGREDGWGWRRR